MNCFKVYSKVDFESRLEYPASIIPMGFIRYKVLGCGLHVHAFDQILHAIRTCLAHLIDDVPVFIQRKCRGKMPHVFLKCFDIIAGFEAVYSESVAKIVKPVLYR